MLAALNARTSCGGKIGWKRMAEGRRAADIHGENYTLNREQMQLCQTRSHVTINKIKFMACGGCERCTYICSEQV